MPRKAPDIRRLGRYLWWVGVAVMVLGGLSLTIGVYLYFVTSLPPSTLRLAEEVRRLAGGALCVLAAQGFLSGGEPGRRLVRRVALVSSLFWLDGVVLAFDPEVATRFDYVAMTISFGGLAYAYFWVLDRPEMRTQFAAEAPRSESVPRPAYAALVVGMAGVVAVVTANHEVASRRVAATRAQALELERSDRSARIERKEPTIWLPFDGSAIDAGAHDFEVTVGGVPPRFDVGMRGQAIVLDGRTNWIALHPYLNVPARVSLKDGATLELWFAPDESLRGVGARATLVVVSGGGNNFGMDLVLTNGRLSIEGHIVGEARSLLGRGDDIQVTPDSETISPTSWTHAALVYDGSRGTLDLFANGKPVGHATGAPKNREWFPISFDVGAWTPSNQSFGGRVDEVLLYEYPRSAADIAVDAKGTD